MRILELYCGIGGCAAAVAGRGEIVAAIDISRPALDAYEANFAHPTYPLSIEGISTASLREFRADLWWLSPPCQPYTRRGKRRDLADPRAGSLLALIERLDEIRPCCFALENVWGFENSATRERLVATLVRCGYQVQEVLLCPTELGWVNQRPRYYLVASRDVLRPIEKQTISLESWDTVLDPLPPELLFVSEAFIEQFRQALHIVDAAAPPDVCRCFTSGYAKMHTRSGSYVRTTQGTRKFSPAEILRLLNFPTAFALPETISTTKALELVGNSLSVLAARTALTAVLP